MLSFPLHIGDWCKSTMHLTHEERGIYLALLVRIYDTEAPLPADIDSIMRLLCVRNADAMRTVEQVLSEFFILEGDGYHNKRADEVISEFKDKSEKARRSAAARWQPQNDADALPPDCARNADAMQTQCGRNAIQYPISNILKPITNNQGKDKKTLSYPDDFLVAWEAYPQRPGASKKTSFKAWQARINQGADPQAIIDGVKRYALYCLANETEPQYIKQPSTFFGPDEHYLADWAVANKQQNSIRRSANDQRAATIAALTGSAASYADNDVNVIDIRPAASSLD